MLPERLSKLRDEKNLSKTFMGNLLGVSRQAYSKYEEGKSEPDIATINKLATFFDVSVGYLTGKTDERNTEDREINRAFHNFNNLTDEEKSYLEGQLEFFRTKFKKDK